MKKIVFLISIFGIFSLLAACTSTEDDPTIQPTEGKLSFVFFYTDG